MFELYQCQSVQPPQRLRRQLVIMGSAVLVTLLGCTPTRPAQSGAVSEGAAAAVPSAASTAVPTSVDAPQAVTQSPQTGQKSVATVSPPTVKATTPATARVAEPTSTTKPAPLAAKPAVKAAAPVATVAKPVSVVAAPAKKPAASTLDLKSLEQHLRETPAIGTFTKLSLKNQVDDLLDEFRDFYRGKVKIQLAELRQRYDLLLMKVLTLLQDSDAKLASSIAASREAIWDILKDPQKFAQI